MSGSSRRFTRALVAAVALLSAVELAGARSARAVQIDYRCDDAAEILQFGAERLQFSVVGETIGAAAMLANLACFVGDSRCACLRNATNTDRNESDLYSREVGRIIATCADADPSRSLSGISQEAVLNICD